MGRFVCALEHRRFLQKHLVVQKNKRNFVTDQLEEPFPLYGECADGIAVPRFTAHFLKQKNLSVPLSETTVACEPIAGNVAFQSTLLDDLHQPQAVEFTLNNLRTQHASLLSLPCGGGKTVCALKIISELGVRTMIVVHTTTLLEQWVERIKRFYPVRVAVLQGAKSQIDNADIVVASLRSLTCKKVPYDPEIFRGIGLCVFDECHRVAAKTLSKSLLLVPSQYTLGLSATPNRTDGLTTVLRVHFGDKVFSKSWKRAVCERVRVVVVKYDRPGVVPYLPFGTTTRPDVNRMIRERCDDSVRLQFVCDTIKHSASRRCLVLSEYVRPLVEMRRRLGEMGVDAGLLTGSEKKSDRRVAVTKNVILATRPIAQEGLDVDGLDTLFLFTSIKDRNMLEQCFGRVMPRGGVSKNTVVFDLVDSFSKTLENHSAERSRWYRKMHFKQCERPLVYVDETTYRFSLAAEPTMRKRKETPVNLGANTNAKRPRSK